MDEPNNEAKSGSSNLWIWMTLLPVSYVLSIGPVAKFLTVIGASPQQINFVKTFYWPLIWLRNNTFLKEPLDAYMSLWGF